MATYRVLIVDNQRRERQTLRDALDSQETDFKVADVASGEEAILVLSRQPVDLLVVEYHLAGMSGLELVQKVRQRHPDVKTIFLGDKANPRIKDQITQADAQAYFFKPVDIPLFQEAVMRCLGLHQPLQAETLVKEEVDISSRDDSVLERLRRELDATAVIMFGDDGQVATSTGDLPDGGSNPALTVSVSALLKAGAEISLRAGNPVPNEALYISGIEFDIFLVRSGQSSALAVLTYPDSDIERRMSVFRSLEAARGALLADAPNTEAAPGSGSLASDPELDALIRQAPNSGLGSEEIDSYWDAAAEQAYDNGMSRPGVLTYEQARKLGLTPPDKK